MENNINKIDNDFDNLVKNDELNISNIEDIIVKNLNNYKFLLHKHVEELMQNKVEEEKLIVKKNENGKTKDINYETKEKKN